MIFSRVGSVEKFKTWIVAILGLAFFVRALIPPGYMPDVDALSRGVFRIVICHGADAQDVAMGHAALAAATDHLEDHAQHKHAHHHGSRTGADDAVATDGQSMDASPSMGEHGMHHHVKGGADSDAADLNKKHDHHGNGSFAHYPCAFSGMASITLFDAVAQALEPIRISFATLIETPPEAPPPIRAGPVLGSRGPPVLS